MGYMVHNGKRLILIFLTHRCPIEYFCLSLHRLILNFYSYGIKHFYNLQESSYSWIINDL